MYVVCEAILGAIEGRKDAFLYGWIWDIEVSQTEQNIAKRKAESIPAGAEHILELFCLGAMTMSVLTY